jgi:hypothetical protein
MPTLYGVKAGEKFLKGYQRIIFQSSALTLSEGWRYVLKAGELVSLSLI